MRQWSGPQPADSLAGWYGPNSDQHGVASDHIHLLDGDVIEINGYAYACTYKVHLPVLCSEIIRIYTEDGPGDGRCGVPVRFGEHACEGHADMRERYEAEMASDLYPDDFEGWI